MSLGRFYLGTPFIPELIAQGLFLNDSTDSFGFSSSVLGDYPTYKALALAFAVYLLTGSVLGSVFFCIWKAIEFKVPILLALLYSSLLWFLLSSLFLPLLGFGFFGRFFAGVPVILEAALLVSYFVYGLILYLFSLGVEKKSRTRRALEAKTE
jgi:hypothetical protein